MSFKKILKRVIGVGLISSMAFGLVACGGDKEEKEVVSAMTKDELIIGVDDTFAPMGFRDKDGQLVGFDIDIATAVGEKLGKKLKFQTIDWTMKETELKNGNIDIIWNGYTITDKRKEQVDFTDAYLKNRQVIVTLADSNIKTKADLAGKKVAAQDRSSAVEAMEGEADVYAGFDGGKAITFETNDLALRDLEAGRVDAVVADEVLINYYISLKGAEKYAILDDNFGEEEYGIGVRKGDTELLNKLNTSLKAIKENGEAAEISKKWFGENKVL